MGEAVLLCAPVPGSTRSRVVEANCGDPQLEADRLELGSRVAFWLTEGDAWGEVAVAMWQGADRLTGWCDDGDHAECDGLVRSTRSDLAPQPCECRCHTDKPVFCCSTS